MASKLENSSVALSIPKLYLNDEFADFTFTFGDVKVPVHKAILASASPVFRAMFFGQIKDKVSVEITDSYAKAFKEFLQLFYLSEVEFSIENIEEVVKLADKYDMLECMNACVEFLEGQLTDVNIIWGYKIAISLKNDQLKQFCEQHITSYTHGIFKSDTFLRCDRRVLTSILQMDTLACNETDVFEGCVSWAKYACQQNGIDENNPENLRGQLGDCLYLIRFAAMTIEDFSDLTKPYQGLLANDEALEIFHAVANRNAKPTRFNEKPRSFPSTDVHWDDTKALLCDCELTYAPEQHEFEKTWVRFSVNVPALLGGCATKFFDGDEEQSEYYEEQGGGDEEQSEDDYDENYSNSCDEHPFIVTIGEIGDQRDDNDSSEFTRVLFKGKMSLGDDLKVPLTHVLPIQPHKTYEIRFERANIENSSPMYFDGAKWQPEYKLNEELIVTFSSTDKFNPVSSMTFCPI